MKQKILISACLLGYNTKYDGKNNLNKKLIEDLKDYELIPICPEVDGGLTTPRLPSEILDDKVINSAGADVTTYYINGANKALNKALDNNIKIAILKSRSPSCGKDKVYDGTFGHKLINGNGITTKLLLDNKIKVYTELDYQDIIKESHL